MIWRLLIAALLTVQLAMPVGAAGGYVKSNDDPRISYFSSESGAKGFTLDRSGEDTLLRFDGAPEVHVLEPVPGPRGDTFFKAITGQTVLRVTAFGGATVYLADSITGVAYGRFGPGKEILIEPKTPTEAQKLAESAASRLNQDFGLKIDINAEWQAGSLEGDGAAVLFQAIENVATGLSILSADPIGKAAVSEGIQQVLLENSQAPELILDGQILIVKYRWAGGFQGRPSSMAVVGFLENNL